MNNKVNNPGMAWAWGEEDAINGNDRRASDYFIMGSSRWIEYNAGYDNGLRIAARLTSSPQLAARVNDLDWPGLRASRLYGST